MSDRRYGVDEHNVDYERGRENERAAIVAWLRDYCEKYPGHHNYRVTRNVANDIERGAHLRGDDE